MAHVAIAEDVVVLRAVFVSSSQRESHSFANYPRKMKKRAQMTILAK